MVFGGKEAPRYASPHNDPLVIETKIVSAIVRRIMIDTGSSVDIITWDCLKKVAHPGCDIVPLVHPTLGFGGQEVNPAGMIRLLVRFGDKLKSKNLEVDFLVDDVPKAYNVILGHPTLHKPADARLYSGGRPRNSYPPEIPEPASPRPCANTPRYRHGPADSLAPWLEPPFQPLRSLLPWPLRAHLLAGTTGLSSQPLGHPDQPLAFPSVAGAGLPAPPAFGTLPRLSPPKANASTIITSSSVILGESEVSKVAKSHDLTNVDEIGGWLVGARGRTATDLRSSPHGLRGGSVFLETGVRSLVDQLPECRGADHSAPASPGQVGADAAVSSERPSVRGRLRTGVASPLLDSAQHRLPLAPEWHPQSQRPSTSPSLALHKIKGKSSQNQTEKLTNIGITNILRKILKDQKGRCGKEEVISKTLQVRELIQRFPITRLTLPPLRALNIFYYLRHKLRDGPGLIVLPYVELEPMASLKGLLTGLRSFQSKTFPLPDSRWTKRKSYFQCFTFDFFLMAVINPCLLLKQYHPKSPVSLEALWMACTRLNTRAEKSNTIVESHAINCYTFSGRFIHGCIRLEDYEGVPYRQEGRPWDRKSNCSDHPTGLSGLGPLETLELIDAPSEDECLYELSEEEEEKVPPEVELILAEATSALGFDELGAE
ncbi:hypothetical protein Cgig2_029997 [Carnegiea gigantea]|uniref:Peptidase A2 domain-containing protein n=1 Tax=Carnegiea gigantea TaxID=171969 RepID=A0A9Q1QDZ0_9CARY|nr:hypothetical protein Cgig2_029997 [Carnegiea gigantea]